MTFVRSDFGDDFHWGVSTAAYQVEGAHDADGKGPSIWDEFVTRKRKIYNRQHGNIACDFYHRYEEDIALIHQLAIPNHRFSISWSRIFPGGTGTVNMQGIDFYNRLIDHTLKNNITPWITLYHWDLPLALQQKGGWKNRDIVAWFSDFVYTCGKYFGDRVKYWIVLNEPMVFTGAGYFLGVHAPGKKGLFNFLPAAHHASLCQAEGGRVIRNAVKESIIGTTFSCSHLEPFRNIAADINATKRADALLNRMFIEPLLGLGYPTGDLKLLKRMEQYMKAGDEALQKFDMDFIGLQNYTRELVAQSHFTPYLRAKIIKANKRNVPLTLMNWEVYPPAIYHILKKFSAYHVKEWVITENGAAFRDDKKNKEIDDKKRLKYLYENIGQVLKARREGIPVNGYFVWTLLDNFEWAEGYHPTFGLVHVNFENQERCIKASGYWYRNLLNGNFTGEIQI